MAVNSVAHGVGTLFLQLLKNYYTFGWPFLLLHILVLILSTRAWWMLRLEIRHLENWKPRSSYDGSESTRLLDEFVAESEELGKQGFLVPVTDFSDRLDSIVDGRVTELYERINLFLIVGIAGTLFGVFEFAAGAADALAENDSSARVFLLGEILSRSLAKAFPVGFIGLALMFVGQMGVSFWENRLKRAVASATKGALQQRLSEEGSVRSQAQIVAEAAARIESAMQPLSNVHDLLERTFGPVMEKLEERLSLSLGHVTNQIEHLEGTTASFSSAVADLRGGVADLGGSTQHLASLLEQAPKVLRRLAELEQKQEQALQEFQASLEKSLEISGRTMLSLEGAIKATQELPTQILRETQVALESVTREVAGVSAAMVGELRQRIGADSDLLFQKLQEQVQIFQQSLLATSNTLAQHLRAEAESLFEGMRKQSEALDGLVQTFGVDLRSNLEAGRQTIAALEKVTQASQELPARILDVTQTALASVSRETSATTVAMVETLRQRLAGDYGHLFHQVSEQINELRESLAATSQELSRHLAFGAEALLTSVRGPVEAVQVLIASVGVELRDTSKASQEATEAMVEALRQQLAGEYSNLFHQVSEQISYLRESLATTSRELSQHLASGAETLLASVEGPVEAVQVLIASVGVELRDTSKASQEAAAAIRGFNQEAKRSLESSFAGMSQESSRLWGVMSDKFGNQTQREFSTFLETIRAKTDEISASLERSAQTWSVAAFNADAVIKEPIAEVLKSFSEELRKEIQNINNLMAQRYPEVVKDVGAFTQAMQGLLVQAQAVQKGLDRWAVSVERSQQEVEVGHDRFLEKLSQAMPQAGSSPELAALLDEKLGKQLVKLSRMDSTLEELLQRRDPLAWLPAKGRRQARVNPGSEPESAVTGAGIGEESPIRLPDKYPDKPPSLWGRLSSWAKRRRH